MSETTDHQKRPPVGLSLLSMVFGSLVGRGANIDHACGVAFLGGLAGSVLILFARKRQRLLATVLLLGAAALAVAVALVASDSATYTAQRSCGFMTSTETAFNDHLYYLYVLWGAPLGFLLWAASRGLVPERKQAEPASSSPGGSAALRDGRLVGYMLGAPREPQTGLVMTFPWEKLHVCTRRGPTRNT